MYLIINGKKKLLLAMIENQTEAYSKPIDLLTSSQTVKICSPMVRYSKLAFRTLVRKYNCDLVFTPMIIADSFVKSLKARDSDFTTNSSDHPLIVQFAAKEACDFADAAEIVSQYADGVDLNCGCPQRWAMAEGYGAKLINDTELVRDMIHQAKNRVSNSDFTVSVKIRIHSDIRKTVELCRNAEACGASWITVHGRTAAQRHEPVNYESIKIIKESVGIPVIANGDIKRLSDVDKVHKLTGVNGVMAARGMLENPAMFAGYSHTPACCVQDWLRIALEHGTPFTCLHHHLIFMLDKVMSKSERKIFNVLSSTASVIDYLQENYDIKR
ncbi:tRNA-dihydrouridine(20a/20b) synthase [NAD(P)+]-like [Nymphon striatum]|nr:tRNA-dihydrouridine(20a/20b) synthase [NAD(P)+]-like [Nymphon striatum]